MGIDPMFDTPVLRVQFLAVCKLINDLRIEIIDHRITLVEFESLYETLVMEVIPILIPEVNKTGYVYINTLLRELNALKIENYKSLINNDALYEKHKEKAVNELYFANVFRDEVDIKYPDTVEIKEENEEDFDLSLTECLGATVKFHLEDRGIFPRLHKDSYDNRKLVHFLQLVKDEEIFTKGDDRPLNQQEYRIPKFLAYSPVENNNLREHRPLPYSLEDFANRQEPMIPFGKSEENLQRIHPEREEPKAHLLTFHQTWNGEKPYTKVRSSVFDRAKDGCFPLKIPYIDKIRDFDYLTSDQQKWMKHHGRWVTDAMKRLPSLKEFSHSSWYKWKKDLLPFQETVNEDVLNIFRDGQYRPFT